MSSSASLGARLESYVTSLIKSGRYQSRNEVLREGVRLVEEREKRLRNLDSALARGVADADAGRLIPAQDVADRLTAKYQTVTHTDKE